MLIAWVASTRLERGLATPLPPPRRWSVDRLLCDERAGMVCRVSVGGGRCDTGPHRRKAWASTPAIGLARFLVGRIAWGEVLGRAHGDLAHRVCPKCGSFCAPRATVAEAGKFTSAGSADVVVIAAQLSSRFCYTAPQPIAVLLPRPVWLPQPGKWGHHNDVYLCPRDNGAGRGHCPRRGFRNPSRRRTERRCSEVGR